jgi:tetratricopeptide (TPR) repeat protein
MPSICLNSIVKNEGSIIRRMLESVEHIIDTYCICDTGSTDNTVEIIKSFFDERNIYGVIIHEPFVNFEHNRNVALKACAGMSDYILLLDADMVLDVRSFNKDDLENNHTYSVLQGRETFYYPNVRIIRNDETSKYVGVTHEYLDCSPGKKHVIMDKTKLFIVDLGDGGSKGDKAERDIRLLKGDLEKNIDNPRSLFYLANTYFDVNNLDEAIPYYLKRIEVGGWEQEIWYSYYRLGEIFKRKDNIAQAIIYWMEGYSIVPERLENIYKIINHYRIAGKPQLAYTYVKLISNVLNCHKLDINIRNPYLFMENDIYTYLIDYEIVILSYYNGNKNVDNPVLSILQSTTDAPIIKSVLENIKFYPNIYTPLFSKNYTSKMFCDVQVNSQNYLFDFKSSSCSIIRNPYSDGYLLNVRYHNYSLLDNGYTISVPENYKEDVKPTVSQNQLIILNNKFDVVSYHMSPVSVEHSKKLIGVEDVRLFYSEKEDTINYIGTSTHNVYDVSIVQGSFDYHTKRYSSPINIRQTFNETNCEKNWVYFTHRNKTRILYSWSPFTVCNLKNSELEVVYQQKMPPLFNIIRNSTCGVVYENELWFVGHIVSHEGEGGLHRHYYDIIIVLDATTLKLIKSSPLFKYSKERIQYTLGLIVDDKNVTLSYSIMDETSHVSVYDKKMIESTMISYIMN